MKSVLLVDDESTFQMLGKLLLKFIGLPPENIHIAETGQQALDLLNKLNAENNLPDLILLDLNMPGMDGFGFLEAYRKTPFGNNTKTSIVVLTSSNSTLDMERIKQFNVTGYLSKPLEEPTLRAALGL